jgi:hypothetical protein
MKSAKRSDTHLINGDSKEMERGVDELDIKVHHLRIDGSDPLALFVELLRKL